MKRAILAACLAALVATPAMAGLASLNPMQITGTVGYDIANQQPGPRGFPYASNNPNGVYDNMLSVPGLTQPAPSTFYAGGILDLPAGAFMCDDITLAPGTTFIGSAGTGSGGLDWVFNNSTQGTGLHNVTIAFLSNPGGNDTSLGATIAAFSFGGGIPNGYYVFTAGLPVFNVPTADIWLCIAHSVPTRHFFSGNPVHGTPGTADPTALYQGSSDNLFLVLSTAGATLFTGGTAPALLNNNWALQGGVPEPSVAALLAIGGLLALRRRKA